VKGKGRQPYTVTATVFGRWVCERGGCPRLFDERLDTAESVLHRPKATGRAAVFAIVGMLVVRLSKNSASNI
jgi:hypothetical protein